jgi:WD40 repeat protein
MTSSRRTWFLLLASTVILGAGLLAATQKSPQQAEVLFESARQKELVDGKLQEAIQIYQRIVQEYSTNRPIAAKALLGMGQCYEKLGQADARKAYERLVRDFGDQAESVTEARARLSALAGSPAAKKQELVARRVWLGDADLTGSPSSDGRLMATTDWYSGDIAIRDLATGEMRRVTKTGDIMKSVVFGFHAKFSPDDKQIAYAWYDPRNHLFELRVVGADGAEARTLYRKENENLYPAAWTPDGKSILTALNGVTESAITSKQIVLVSADSGAMRVLKPSGRDPTRMSVSPDGRFLVYDAAQADGKRDIFVLSLQDGRESRLVEHAADDRGPIWTPDGRQVLFVSDRTGSAGLWAQEVADGKPLATPELVRPETGRISPMGFTRSGALYYGLSSDVGEVFAATLDLRAGRLLEKPAPVSQRVVAARSLASWSPDGTVLAYLSKMEPAPPGNTITLRTVDTGEERDIHVDAATIRRLDWFPDGTALVVPGLDAGRKPSVFRVDVKSGTVTTIFQRANEAIWQASVTRDGKTLVCLTYSNDRQSLISRHLQTGQEKVIIESRYSPMGMGLSPDGQQVAVTAAETAPGGQSNQQVLIVIPVAGGVARELHRVGKPGGFLRFASWTPDGTQILSGITQQDTSLQLKTEYFLVPATGGEPKKIASLMAGITDLSFNPDGKRIAFAAGRSRSEVWVIENFLPPLKR